MDDVEAEPASAVKVAAPPDAVFDLLTDPATYPRWLVGADRIRRVDQGWPAVGTRFHHVVGRFPAVLAGSTSVRSLHRPDHLELGAGLGPLGEARVRFDLAPSGHGGSRLSVHELPSRGVVRVLWWVGRPVVRWALWGRNQWSLDALRELVESDPRWRR